MKKFKWITLALLLMAAGCSTSKITSSWKAENTAPQKYNKILVLGLIRETDRTIQEKMENHFVGDLKDLGYNAVSSLQEYGPKAFDKMDEEAAIVKLKTGGVNAVITIVLLNKEKERKYMPARAYFLNDFWDYYGSRRRLIYEPGYYISETKYFWESNFYDMSNQALLYSVQTQSFSPNNTESMGHEYGQIIVKNMVKLKVLKQQVATEPDLK